MKKIKKPEQISNLFQLIKECIDQGRYLLSEHAIQRLHERSISLNDAEYVLRNGYHEKKKLVLMRHLKNGNTQSVENPLTILKFASS